LALSLFRKRRITPRLERLRALSLFTRLDAAELGIIDGLLHERDYLPGEVIFDEGEEGQALYIVLEGEVLICRQGEPTSGRIATLSPGTFFGDIALIDSEPRSAQARASDSTRLAVFFRADFLDLMETHARISSKIAMELARHMGRRLRDLNGDTGSEQHL
jgi:CRP-like cAMP-binding protein